MLRYALLFGFLAVLTASLPVDNEILETKNLISQFLNKRTRSTDADRPVSSSSWSGIALPGTFGDTGLIYFPENGNYVKRDNFGVKNSLHQPATSLCAYNKLYISGGTDDTLNFYSNLIAYDPESNVNKQVGSLQFARYGHSMTCLDETHLLVCGGISRGGLTDSCELCAINTNIVSDQDLLCAQAFPRLPTKMTYMAEIVLDGDLYIVGGVDTAKTLDTLYKLDKTTDTFVQKTSMSQVRYYPGIAVHQGKILVCGGRTGTKPEDKFLDSCERYDPTTDAWSAAGTLNTARFQLGLVDFNNKLYAVAGSAADPSSASGEKKLSSVEALDDDALTWSEVDIKLQFPNDHANLAISIV